MDALFPFGFPWPTAMYLTFYVVTAAIYAVFMHYTLAGALVLAIGRLRVLAHRLASRGPEAKTVSLGLLEHVVEDWLPVMLGMTITAGIAPLLFLQILYKQSFYTANLLLFHRFMLLLPALIVAYYMLYLQKSKKLHARGPWPRAAAVIVVALCFGYTAWAWAENHLLSLHREAWGEFYGSGRWFFPDSELWPRLGYTITAAFATFALVVGWQLAWGRRGHDQGSLDLAARQLRLLALLGLFASAFEAILWYLWLETPAQAALRSILAMPYGVLVFLGIAVQAACWLPVNGGARLTPRRLAIATAGAAGTMLGAVVAREVRRLVALDLSGLEESHRQAARVGGMAVFLTFFLVNALVIAACVWIVKRDIAPAR